MKIQIKNRYNGSIIFEHECDYNTIKKTVEKAVIENKSLSNSDLRNSNLSGSDLRNSNFRNLDLSGSYLRNSDLSNSDLRNSNLSGSDLRNSNFSGSDLRNSVIPIFSKWSAGIIDNKIIKIGCKKMTIEDWDLFFASEEEFETKRGTAEFKQIQAMYLACKAYLTHLNN